MYACIKALKDYVGPLRQQITGALSHLVQELGYGHP